MEPIERKSNLILFNTTLLEMLEDIEEKEQGNILKAVVENWIYNKEPEFTDTASKIVYKRIIREALKNEKTYTNKCAKNKENAEKRWEKEKESKTQDTSIDQKQIPELYANTNFYGGNLNPSPEEKKNILQKQIEQLRKEQQERTKTLQ